MRLFTDEIKGPPVTEELQLLFGWSGTVKGIVAYPNGPIEVLFEEGHSVRCVIEEKR